MSNRQIRVLENFRNAYRQLLYSWDENGSNLNDTTAIKDFPFDKSLDELNVSEWVNRTVHELKQRDAYNDHNGIRAKEIDLMLSLIRNLRVDDVKVLTVEEFNHLEVALKCAKYVQDIRDFYKYLVDAMPDGPNSTPEEQEALDKEWERFYETPWIISFGGRSVRIENEATIYDGITDTLKDMIDDCL